MKKHKITSSWQEVITGTSRESLPAGQSLFIVSQCKSVPSNYTVWTSTTRSYVGRNQRVKVWLHVTNKDSRLLVVLFTVVPDNLHHRCRLPERAAVVLRLSIICDNNISAIHHRCYTTILLTLRTDFFPNGKLIRNQEWNRLRIKAINRTDVLGASVLWILNVHSTMRQCLQVYGPT